MADRLARLFEKIEAPAGRAGDKPLYAVMPAPGHPHYFIGKDKDERACLLIATSDQGARPQPPIRLESLDAQFALRCHLRKDGDAEREGTFTVIRCRVTDRQTIGYFLSVCGTLMKIMGENPAGAEIAAAVNRLAAIFQKILRPPRRPLSGLFGELFLISRSANPARSLAAWRVDDHARFDFSDGDIRIDVKATTGRHRVHSFSFEQCNAPQDTIAVVASLHAEQIAGGVALGALVQAIEDRVAAQPNLVLKLHETVAATLGQSLAESLDRGFDLRLAASSLAFFDLADVPAIRGDLPAGVSELRFKSDLSALMPLSLDRLIDRDPLFFDLLPICADR